MRLERRRMTDCQTLLAVLDDGAWHTGEEILNAARELNGKSMIVHSRKADLVKRGYVIDCESGAGWSRYRLIASPDELAEAASLPAAPGAASGAAGSESATEPLPPPECRAGTAAAWGGSVKAHDPRAA